MTHYQRPSWFTANIFNRLVAVLTRLGVSVWGSRVLAVRGRKTGQWRRTPVNLLVVDGVRYLVAPRGHTQWVRNLRETGEGRLLLGRRSEDFRATEIPDEERPALLRRYIKRWNSRWALSSEASVRTPRNRSPAASPPTTRSSDSIPSPGAG